MSQAQAGPVSTVPHVRMFWDSWRRDPHYAVAVVQAAARAQEPAASVDVSFDAHQLHVYGIEPRDLHHGLCAVIACGERRLVGVADQAEFLPDGRPRLSERLWARWNEAEAAIDFATALRTALEHAFPDTSVMSRSGYPLPRRSGWDHSTQGES